MTVTLELSAVDRLADDLARAAAVPPREARGLVRRYGALVRDTARELVHVRSGDTRDSIGFTSVMFEGGARATVGPTTFYAPFLEFGTSRSAPNPFMEPAMERHAAAFDRDVEALVDETLRRARLT